MKVIPLSQNKKAVVSDADYARVSQYKWSALKARRTFYAVRVVQQKMIYMHRFILNDPPGQVDHRDTDGLNNTRRNLRRASDSLNHANQKKCRPLKSSPFKGVSRLNRWWQARIGFQNKRIYLGIFDSPIKAARAYNRAARQLFKNYARVN